jgi:hypothetical protein
MISIFESFAYLDAFYSAEVVSKLRQKEQTQSFINKPCSLFVTDRTLVIFDRATQVRKNKTNNSFDSFFFKSISLDYCGINSIGKCRSNMCTC